MEHTIDASAAIKALGINHPVKFVDGVLNPFGDDDAGLSLANIFGGGLVAAATIAPGDVVKVDWPAIDYMQKHRRQFGNAYDAEETIAHELIHVRDMQDMGTNADEINAAYIAANDPRRSGLSNATGGNAFEAKAIRLAPQYKSLVKVN